MKTDQKRIKFTQQHFKLNKEYMHKDFTELLHKNALVEEKSLLSKMLYLPVKRRAVVVFVNDFDVHFENFFSPDDPASAHGYHHPVLILFFPVQGHLGVK